MNFDKKSLFIILFIFFSEKAGLVDYFAAAFIVPNVHQIWQILYEMILCIVSTTPCDQVGLNNNILKLVTA